MGFNCLNDTKPLQGDSLLFTTKTPGGPGIHQINLGGMKGWIDLGATQWFWLRDSWLEIWHSDHKVFALLYVRVCHDISCCGIKKISFLKVDHNFNISLNTRNRNVMLSSSFHLLTMFGSREALHHHEISRYLVCYILFSDANVCEDLLIHICIIKASFCGIKTTVFQVLHPRLNAGTKTFCKFATFTGNHLQWRPIFSKVFIENRTPLLVCCGEVSENVQKSYFINLPLDGPHGATSDDDW